MWESYFSKGWDEQTRKDVLLLKGAISLYKQQLVPRFPISTGPPVVCPCPLNKNNPLGPPRHAADSSLSGTVCLNLLQQIMEMPWTCFDPQPIICKKEHLFLRYENSSPGLQPARKHRLTDELPFVAFSLHPFIHPSHPIQSNPIQSNPIQSNPIQSNPIQSNPIQSNPSIHPSRRPCEAGARSEKISLTGVQNSRHTATQLIHRQLIKQQYQ